MAANCKNTASLPVLYWQDNWTPDIDQKKAPPKAESYLNTDCGHRPAPTPHYLGLVIFILFASWPLLLKGKRSS
jgi:hypothetical protein